MRAKNLIWIILILALNTACNPFISKELREKNRENKRLERFLKRNPGLAVTDTIIDTVRIKVPEIHYRDTFMLNTDVSGVDSILLSFKAQLDSLQHLELTQIIKNYTIERPFIKDTIFREFEKGFIKIWNDNGQMVVYFHVYEQEVQDTSVFIYRRAMQHKLSLMEQAQSSIGSMMNWIFWIILVMLILFVIRYILKIFFPKIP